MSAVVGLLGDPFADAMRSGAAWVMSTTLGWWVGVPAVDLTTSPAQVIRGYVLWLSLVVATLGVMWQGVLMVVSRRPDPLLGIGRGLFTLTLWAAVGIAGPAAALRGGDAFATWVLDQAADGKAAERLMRLGSLTGVDSTGAVIVLGLLLMFSGIAQAIVMIFREGAVVVLAGVVVLAASGSFTAATRPWLPRVLGWLAALIAYKPAAALVYATAVAMIGDGTDARTIFVGLTMMLLAIVALPALMKFFTWTTGSVASGGGLALLGASASALTAGAAMHSYSAAGGASGQASSLRRDLGPPTAPLPPAGAPAAPPPSTPPPGPAASGVDASAPAGAGPGAAAGAGTAAGGAATGGGATVALVVAQAAVAGLRQASDAAGHHLTGDSRS